MERLYTERQLTRYINYLCLFIFIIFIIQSICNNGISASFFKEFLIAFIIFVIIEAGLLWIWYPDEYMKKIAMEKGQVYIAKIKGIDVRNRSGISLVKRAYVYVMTLECEVDSEKRVWELGNYIDNPTSYIPMDFTCKVYVYNNKCYVQDFYKASKVKTTEQQVYKAVKKKVKEPEADNQEFWDIFYGKYDNTDIHELLKYSIEELPYLDNEQFWEACKERDKYSSVRSKTYIIPLTHFFMGLRPYFKMVVEVHMKSKKAYREMDFCLNEKISHYIVSLGVNYELSKEQIVEDISRIVRDTILSQDKRIVIEQIYVVIR